MEITAGQIRRFRKVIGEALQKLSKPNGASFRFIKGCAGRWAEVGCIGRRSVWVRLGDHECFWTGPRGGKPNQCCIVEKMEPGLLFGGGLCLMAAVIGVGH